MEVNFSLFIFIFWRSNSELLERREGCGNSEKKKWSNYMKYWSEIWVEVGGRDVENHEEN